MIDIKHIVKHHSCQNIPIGFNEAYALGELAISGCKGDSLAQIQSITAMTALHNKALYSWEWSEVDAQNHPDGDLPRNAAEQVAGICAAIFDHDIKPSEFGFLNPKVQYVMDNCGMGGDLTLTANVSTIAALIASCAGYVMCKHGSPGNTVRTGSSDFVQDSCGINILSSKKSVERSVEQYGFGYTEALDTRYKLIHLQTHQVARLSHMNDIIGPITNPVNPLLMKRRMIGINHLISPHIIAEAYRIMNEKGVTNVEHLLAVRGLGDENGKGGVDEVSICKSGTLVAELKDGVIREFVLTPQDFGVESVSLESISPPSGMSKADFSLGILKGEISGGATNMVLANAALLFYLGGFSESFKSCYEAAREVYESGAPYQKVLALQKFLPQND